MSYRVFLKAPTAAELKKLAQASTYHWQTASSSEIAEEKRLTTPEPDSQTCIDRAATQPKDTFDDWILPPATLDAASQRISEMYKNIIFADEEEEQSGYEGEESGWDDSRLKGDEISHAIAKEGTLISWPPTNLEHTRSQMSLARTQGLSRVNTSTQFETQENSKFESYAHTSTSSIAAFPTFIINLHTLASLSTLVSITTAPGPTKWSKKVQLLVAVLEVDGPNAVVIKKGPDAGKEVGVLKLVIGDELGPVCKLTAWREAADRWGGVRVEDEDESRDLGSEGVRRGDIVYLENIMASSVSPSAVPERDQRHALPVSLTASPNLASRLHICYRTLPSVASDRRLRPDLRLAASDPGLRKVAGVVKWFQDVVGLS